MSIGVISFHGAVSLGASIHARVDKDGCGWINLDIQGRKKAWETAAPLPDQITIHFEPEAMDKFQRLAALINETFGENTTQETSSEV